MQIRKITIENFRGITKLVVPGFSRVSLITGKNDAGKTALLEALLLASASDHSPNALAFAQGRRKAKAQIHDFDNFWRPAFREGDAERGISLEIETDLAKQTMQRLWKEPATTVLQGNGSDGIQSSWSLACEIKVNGATPSTTRAVCTGPSVAFPPAPQNTMFWWVEPTGDLTDADVRNFSALKQAGRDAEIVEMLRLIDSRIAGVDILAPTGLASLFFRMHDSTIMLPAFVMGGGVQRCLEYAIGLASSTEVPMFIDEIENGLHHSTLESIWAWISAVTKKRNIQLFVTTHSEECIQAASKAFASASDDGLRVIRIDKKDNHTSATVYTRDLIEAAEQMDVEIRG